MWAILPVFAAIALSFSSRTTAWGVTSPQTVGSGITILTHNDLYGNNSCRDESILVLDQPKTSSAAAEACKVLGERLWTASEADFLPYLAYEGKCGSYWAASSNGTATSVQLTEGGLGGSAQVDSKDKLPVLCTNSAPLSTVDKQDNSSYWQVQVPASETQWITGFRDKVSFRFEGIRYASQPERFTYSTIFETNQNTSALTFQSECVQAPNVGSEDCLFLNVWTPYLPLGSRNDTALKPVMVNIHGGAFTSGTGNDPTFDGGVLASRGDVVLVTINYRLTTLGFLALDDGVTNGNFGLADQITALRWVQRHIKAFGGDPSRITILGQSAGAGSVRALMASPIARGLFAAAIPQSNLAGLAYATTYSDYLNRSAEIQLAADPILNATGCLNATSQVDCLRKIDPFVLANLSTVASYVIQDGKYIVTPRLEVTDPSQVANVHLMLGFMRDDGAPFIPYPKAGVNVSTELSASGFASVLSTSTLSLYPVPGGLNATTDIYNASAALATDGEFRCLDQATAYSGALHESFKSVWMYEFNRSYNGYDPNPPVCEAPVEAGYPFGNPEKEYFKCHSGDLNYAFGSLSYLGLPDRDGLDIPMSQYVVDTWSSFSRTYDPTPDIGYLQARGFVNTTMTIQGSSHWVQVDPQEPTLRVLQYPSYQAPFPIFSSTDRCEALGLPLDYYESN